MNVMRFNFSDALDAPALMAGAAPAPEPGPGEILVRVFAAGVTPTELLWYPTTHTRDGPDDPAQYPDMNSPESSRRSAARSIQTRSVARSMGASAEYCISAPGSVAAKPFRSSHAEAATVPIGALTAWQGLFDRAKLREGDSGCARAC